MLRWKKEQRKEDRIARHSRFHDRARIGEADAGQRSPSDISRSPLRSISNLISDVVISQVLSFRATTSPLGRTLDLRQAATRAQFPDMRDLARREKCN